MKQAVAMAILACTTCVLGSNDETWWSCIALEKPAVPGSNMDAHPIDRFLAIEMDSLGLTPSNEADPRTLVRRATYDLTGLPAPLDAIKAFEADDDATAWNTCIDRLLESEQYGVKWGRHWLDLVRWAETNSFERDSRKPAAWRYRDWVIDAFNSDMPYDRFILEQLAGDELPDRSLSSMIATGYYRLGIWDDEPTDIPLAQYDDLDGILDTTSRVMLGMSMGCARCHDHKKDPIPQADYYRMLAFFHGITPYKSTPGNSIQEVDFLKRVPDNLDNPDIDLRHEQAWLEERNRLTNSIIESHAGLVNSPAPPVDRNGLVLALEDGTREIESPVADDFTVEFEFMTTEQGHGDHHRNWWTGSGLISAEVPGIVNDWGITLQGTGYIVAGTGNPEQSMSSASGYNDGDWHHVAFARDRESGMSILYIDGEPVAEGTGSQESLDAPRIVLVGEVLPGRNVFKGSIRNVRFWDRVLPHRGIVDLALGLSPLPSAPGSPEHEALVKTFMDLHRPVPPTTDVLCVMEPDTTPPETRVLARGNPAAQLEVVGVGFPGMLGGGEPGSIQPTDESSGRRLALARWIIDPDNIRTSRVLVNRIWQHHFGTGLVPTPNDFGMLGLPPTHPALLDWLACEFIERGMSIKEMHRLIMTSGAYRRSGSPVGDARSRDPLNTALSWYPMQRLTAEELRDSLLSVNGTLNLELGGPSIYPKMPAEVLATSSRPDAAWGISTPEQAARRSVYIHLKRSLLDPMLTAFDLADTDSTCPVRFVTSQPTQALTMLNSEFINTQAHLLADRLRVEYSSSEDRVRGGIELALCRPANVTEVQQGLLLLDEFQEADGLDPGLALDRYCLLLLNLNEFIYVD